MAPYSHPKLLKRTKSPSSAATTFKRSPLIYRGRVRPRTTKAPDPRLPGTRYNKHLPTIPELSPDRDRRRSLLNPVYNFDFDTAQHSDQDSDNEEEETPTFTWEDEKTLVSDLLHNGHEQESEDVKLTSLADSLQACFSMYSKELVDDMADTLVPAVNRVKRGHQMLNEQVDDSFALGVLQFDEACKKLETVTIGSHNELKKAYHASQARIQDLIKDLKEAFSRRDQLWVDFEKVVDETLDPVIEDFKSLPPRMERVINTMERNCKKMEKESGGKEQYLKGILSKFA